MVTRQELEALRDRYPARPCPAALTPAGSARA